MKWLAAGLLAVALVPAAARTDEAARSWLARMNEAVGTETYRGEFTVESGRNRERLAILHRAHAGRVNERLVALSGSRRELVRDGEEVTAYLPDQRIAVIERRAGRGALLGTLPQFGPDVEKSYELALGERVPSLLGGQAQLVSVRPRDVYRFGFRLWIDERTAMPVRTEMVDSQGTVREAVVFTRLELRPQIADAEFQPSVDPREFRWIKQGLDPGDKPEGWRAAWMPPGFRLSVSAAQLQVGSQQPVTHLVYTDGLASVSVFIQQPAKGQAPRSGTGQMGAAAAVSTVVQGWQVTAVGEVPAATLQQIAGGMQPAGRKPPP